MVNEDPCHSYDKLGLFILAGLVVTVLGGIVLGTYWKETVPDKGDVLIGGIATGLILFLRDLVAAVRGSWEEVTRGKTMDTLGASSPLSEQKTLPDDVTEAVDQVAEAATDKADQIKGGA